MWVFQSTGPVQPPWISAQQAKKAPTLTATQAEGGDYRVVLPGPGVFRIQLPNGLQFYEEISAEQIQTGGHVWIYDSACRRDSIRAWSASSEAKDTQALRAHLVPTLERAGLDPAGPHAQALALFCTRLHEKDVDNDTVQLWLDNLLVIEKGAPLVQTFSLSADEMLGLYGTMQALRADPKQPLAKTKLAQYGEGHQVQWLLRSLGTAASPTQEAYDAQGAAAPAQVEQLPADSTHAQVYFIAKNSLARILGSIAEYRLLAKVGEAYRPELRR